MSEPAIAVKHRPTLILLVCLLLPLIGLGYSWSQAHRASLRGIMWEVPVTGYDPRDLRGHYVQFRYDWPGIAENPRRDRGLCLSGTAPTITAVREVDALERPANCPTGAYIPADNRLDKFDIDRGRIYVPQAQASAYERRLASTTERAFIRVRLDDNGALRPVELLFKPAL